MSENFVITNNMRNNIYLLASTQGDEKAKDDAPLLEMVLTPEQIAAGKRLAENFKPRERTQP